MIKLDVSNAGEMVTRRVTIALFDQYGDPYDIAAVPQGTFNFSFGADTTGTPNPPNGLPVGIASFNIYPSTSGSNPEASIQVTTVADAPVGVVRFPLMVAYTGYSNNGQSPVIAVAETEVWINITDAVTPTPASGQRTVRKMEIVAL